MKLCMIGTGYVGLVSGVCFSDLGNDVICVDRDIQKINSLKKGKVLKIAKLGTFKIKNKNSRIGRNPKTGKESIISARSVVTFNASEKLKSRLNLK